MSKSWSAEGDKFPIKFLSTHLAPHAYIQLAHFFSLTLFKRGMRVKHYLRRCRAEQWARTLSL